MTFFSTAVAELIEVGQLGQERIPESLADADEAWRIMVGREAEWTEAANGLTSAVLNALVRGLVLYSRASGRSIGHSVSPVITLCRAFAHREPEQEGELMRWVLAHTDNAYEPFGSLYTGGATSYAEFVAHRFQRCSSGDGERPRREAEEARQRREAQATTRLAPAVRRGDLVAVKALLAKGADVKKASDGTSLVALAEANGRAAVADYLKSRGIG